MPISRQPIEMYALRNCRGEYYQPGIGYPKWRNKLQILSKASYHQLKAIEFQEPITVEIFEVRYKSEKPLEALNGKQVQP